ncbi:MAG TPA: hypothetical protein VNO52_19095, partial [Methylomirabilota bacterium]|nr:hypothetical protein [Methylomirabilota bacterium]
MAFSNVQEVIRDSNLAGTQRGCCMPFARIIFARRVKGTTFMKSKATLLWPVVTGALVSSAIALFGPSVSAQTSVSGLSPAELVAAVNATPPMRGPIFSGSINLDGDISDFFEPDGVTPKAGVCVVDDPSGLDESPLEGGTAGATRDNQRHPSGFNQRRIMTAYTPGGVNGGTIYVGIDLPGGSGADSGQKLIHSLPGVANPNFFDGVVGGNTGFGRGKIIPFDADANGEADTIGRTLLGGPLFRCTDASAGDTIDIVTCSFGAQGFTDNPRLASGEVIGARENYVATVVFGNGQVVTVEVFQNGDTAPGNVQVRVDPPTFGAIVNTSTGGDGSMLGWDVEIAITKVDQAVADVCARLHHMVICDSGSNRDGASQGEDQNVVTCLYTLPSSLELTKSCVGAATPGGLAMFTGSVRNTGQQPLFNVSIVNDQPVPGTAVTNFALLNPGETATFAGSYVVSSTYTNCSITDTLTATAATCGGSNLTATASATCPVRHTLELRCPADLRVQCLGDVPAPDVNSVIVTSSIGSAVVVHAGDIVTGDGCEYVITRTYTATDLCTNTASCVQTIRVSDTIPPVITCPQDIALEWVPGAQPQFGQATASDNCDTNLTVVFQDLEVPATCPSVRIFRRTWTATDDCTNSASCSQTITYVDTTPPV